MKKLLGACALLASLGFSGSANASLNNLTDLFVFGDSLSDGGNSSLASFGTVPPYPSNRYSNGAVAVEYLWQNYNPGNLDFTPSLAGGTNYAIGGSTTGSANYNSVNPRIPLPAIQSLFDNKGNAWQLNQFATQAPVFDPATSLFVIWLFPNDVFAANQLLWPGTVPGSPGGPNLIANGIANILTTIQTLAFAGAQHFLVPNMPDLGATPEFVGTPQAGALSALTDLFNTNLALQLNALNAPEIVQFDTHTLFQKLVADPAAYGFEVADKACVDNLVSGVCNPTNWDKWVFWDGVHPTTAAHRVLGAQFAAAVPEPASIMLLALGLFGIAALRKRQSL